MAYPYSKAGGGISSVAWGDITGDITDQLDLQSELDLKQDVGVEPVVEWGDITGTLADQSDLNVVLEDLEDRVAALEAGSGEWLDATDTNFWAPGSSGYAYTWSTDHWVGATEEDEPSFPRFLQKNGGWVTDYRPTAARVTLNSGPEPTYAGDYSGPMSVAIKDGFGSNIGAVYDVEFTAWDQDLVVDIEELEFSGTGIGTDIERLEVYSTTRSVGPLIKKIEFLPAP